MTTSSSDTDDSLNLDDGDEEAINLAMFDESGYQRRTGSFSASALPHAYVGEGLEWIITRCVTDEGRDVDFDPDTTDIGLLTDDWNHVTLDMEVTVPNWAFEIVDPDDPKQELRLGIVYWCRRTILRDSSDTQTIDGPGTYDFSLTINRDQVRSRIKLHPSLVRADDTGTDSQYAIHPGHRMLEGREWTLRIDRDRPTRNLLQPEEKEFSSDDNLPNEDHLIYIDFDHSPPKIYLNKDHQRLLIALDSDANQGWDASVRDVAYALIEAEIWPQLILEAAAGITADEGPEEIWRQGVIEEFRERIYGDGTSYEEAIDRLREDTNDPQRMARLMHDIDDGLQSKFDSPSSFDKLLSLIDG